MKKNICHLVLVIMVGTISVSALSQPLTASTKSGEQFPRHKVQGLQLQQDLKVKMQAIQLMSAAKLIESRSLLESLMDTLAHYQSLNCPINGQLDALIFQTKQALSNIKCKRYHHKSRKQHHALGVI